MRREGVLLLGIIVCWIALCIDAGEYSYDYDIDSTTSEELGEENLFLAAASEKTCVEDEDCGNKRATCQKKAESDTEGICQCDEGLGGADCEEKLACKTGIFKRCNGGVNGTCDYDDEERKFTCTCESESGRELHPNENRCKETCKVDGDCQYGGKCEKNGDHNFCNCQLGFIGDKCGTVFDCTKDGKYKGCEDGTCSYDENDKKAVCVCNDGKKLHDIENVCKDCSCGENGVCSFKNGEKSCACNKGFEVKDGGCEECSCGDNGDCSFKEGKKSCDCKQGFARKGETCEVCDCGTGGTCEFKGDKPECSCKEGYVSDGEKCKECDCSPGGTCELVGGEPECTCLDGYEEHEGKCIECNCGLNGTCSLDDDGKKTCDCNEDFSEKNGICEVCDCGSNGECSFVEGNKNCKCKGGYTEIKGKCVAICTKDDECLNQGKCKGKEGKKVCSCKRGTEGEKCGTVTDCISGKFSECEGSEGKCGFDGTQSTCTCPDHLILDINLEKPICRANCSEEDEGFCQNGALCKDDFCECPEGTKGDDCSTVILCETLKCKEKDATCKYDATKTPKATCECNDPKFTFEGDKCVAKWCSDACKGDTKCEYTNEVGICKCTKEGKYYDYVSKECKDYDRCFNKTCEGDLICNNGNCECPQNKQKNATVCEEKDLCNDKNVCFSGTKCEAGKPYGYVKCLCDPESSFYNPKSGNCEDGSCFLNADKKKCTKSCPKGMTRKDGICTYKKNETICDKNCGFLGYCFKEGDKQNCLCDPTYAVLNTTSGICILKADAVCPSAQLDGGSKCKCTGKYKQAKNGITCELRTCSDEDVQKECQDIRAAKCVDNWKGAGASKGFLCECPTGYVKDEKKGCIDPCNQEKSKNTCSSTGQLCYIGDRDKLGECRCPPTFTYDETKKSCDLKGANTFMIRDLPVLSKKYETGENVINKVALAIDISTSMKQTFANLDFVHVFSLKKENNVLFCDVWLQFKSNIGPTFNATLEVQRWKTVSVKAEDQFLLPPSLLLSSSHIDQASEEELTLCTSSVKQSLCGAGSTCADNKCSCANGFREIDTTIRATDKKRIVRCEDIDECEEASHSCKKDSTCVNTIGSYYCRCNPGFKKAKGDADAMNQEECTGLCQAGTCGKGECKLNDKKAIECTCQLGYSGSYCNRKDENLAKAANSTKVVGAVLGTLLGIVIILIIVYIVRQRKNSYSEDFSPAPRIDNAEMSERRPMRGVTNRAFQ